MIIKKCKYCGESDEEKLFSFKRKKDKNRCICNVCKICYSNVCRQKQIGKKHSKTTKQKLRDINLGKPQTKETIEKRRKSLLGHKVSQKTRDKIRKANTGFKHSKETRKKMSLNQIGRKQSKATIAKRVAKLKGKKHPPRPDGFSEKMSVIMKKAMNNPITKEKNRQHFYECLRNTKLGKPTDIEQKLIKLLNKNKIGFVRNKFFARIKHGYAVDFLLEKYNIVIEADGDYWHKYPHGNEIDHIRIKELTEQNFSVLRFWGREIHKNIKCVEKTILDEIHLMENKKC